MAQSNLTHSTYNVKNVKIHVNVHKPIIVPNYLQDRSKQHSNFTVIRVDGFVFILFLNSGFANISGIKNFESIKGAVDSFNHHFSTTIQREHIVIDNSTASGKLAGKNNVHLHKLINSPIIDSAHLSVSIRPHYFPSATIRGKPNQICSKRKQKCRVDFATCVIFSNGKFIIVGGKSINQIENTFSILCQLTKHL